MKVQVKYFKSFAIWFTIAIVGITTLNNSIFLHTHKLESGTFVSHAHPFNKSAESQQNPSHNHTKNEIYLYQILSQLDIILFIIFGLQIFSLAKHYLRNYILKSFIPLKDTLVFKTRPPPTIV